MPKAASLMLGCLLASLSASHELHAQSPVPVRRGPALNWVRRAGAESCVPPVELAVLVEQRLGRRVFVRASDAIVVIEGLVSPSQPIGFEAVIKVSDPDGTLYGTRSVELPDADCRKLDDIIALIVAVTIRRAAEVSGISLPPEIVRELDRLFEPDSSELDPQTLPAPVETLRPVGPQPSAAGRGAPAMAAGSAGSDSEAPELKPEWGLELGVSFATGLQPSFTFGAAVGLSVALDGIGSAALSGMFGIPSREENPGEEAGELEYSVLQAGLQLCAPSWKVGPSALALCGSARVGRILVTPQDFLVMGSEAVDEVWVELAPEISGHALLYAPVSVQLRLGVPIRVEPPSFDYTDSQGSRREAFSVAPVGLRIELGFGLGF